LLQTLRILPYQSLRSPHSVTVYPHVIELGITTCRCLELRIRPAVGPYSEVEFRPNGFPECRPEDPSGEGLIYWTAWTRVASLLASALLDASTKTLETLWVYPNDPRDEDSARPVTHSFELTPKAARRTGIKYSHTWIFVTGHPSILHAEARVAFF